MKTQHQMPFGAEVLDDGAVRFALWAPDAKSVELCVEQDGVEKLITMPAAAGGFYRLTTAKARAGSRYRYRIDQDLRVPDPASRFNVDDVHGTSVVIDPRAYRWTDAESDWRGRPWNDAVIYELHLGAFTADGTFRAAIERLDYLAELGVTVLEIMPVADFPGRNNWGYDGVLLFAPESRYGKPDDFKALIEAAHARGLMVLLDVVYNHFGPDGNYLNAYASQYFTEHYHTPWGAAINFGDEGSRAVRDFCIHNVLYWIEEYRLDGLRFDAVHEIRDDESPKNILYEIAEAVHHGPGAERHIHLILENDHNAASFLKRSASGQPLWYTAQWNDDFHHAMHVLLTNETDGYYCDYAEAPARYLARALAEGFSYQGQTSKHRHGMSRGEPSAGLPPIAFVSFLQNHDQVGNTAFGSRVNATAEVAAMRAATALLLLSPMPPLLFMGQEFATDQPFPFFCDFGPPLCDLVTAGRRKEFERFPAFRDPEAQQKIPDPNAPETAQSAVLDWSALDRDEHRGWLEFHRSLLQLRRTEIAPRLSGVKGAAASYRMFTAHAFQVAWRLGDGSCLTLSANLCETPAPKLLKPEGELLYAEPERAANEFRHGNLPAWSVLWHLARARQ
ncbi:MAG: malto-oligosyltrehalose trehalohydrolase [Burkholderiales bacterium]|nr:malto-oligosyltrehalose trehalohydrolase [Burkholderiales bacterium]